MRRVRLGILLIAVGSAAIMLGCGGGDGVLVQDNLSPQTGSLVVFGGDAPLCSVISFDVTISGATLTPQGGGDPVSVISSTDPVRVDFASLMGFTSVLNFASAPAGRYSQISLTLSDPQITVLSGSPPAPETIDATMSSLTVTVDIIPVLEIRADQSAGLLVDFRLIRSIETDVNAQVTGMVDPIFRVSPTVISVLNGLGDWDEFHGLVESVSTVSTDPSFIGSFDLQIGRRRAVVVQVTDQTRFEGVAGLGELTPRTFVEVHAFIDSDGRIVARHVDVEEREDENERRVAFVGLVTRVDRNAQGQATRFGLFIRREFPDVRDTVPLRAILEVDITPDTRFGIAALGLDRRNRLFNPLTLGTGQHVVAHGVFTPGTPPTLTAAAVYLRRQRILGNFQPPLLAVGSDGKTGGFTLLPCNPIFQMQPINVLTFSGTEFEGIDDLNGLTEGPLYLTRGLLFYEQTPGLVNGVSWNPPPPVYVHAAGRVRELE